MKIRKNKDILNPQSVDLVIGSISQSLSAYQLQSQEAIESIERVKANQEIERKKENLNSLTSELEKLKRENKEENADKIKNIEMEMDRIKKEIGGSQ